MTETSRWICVLLLAAGAAWAQEPDLRTTVRLVVAPTTVVDAAGHYVDGLSADDFLVFDNGQPRRVNADVSYTPISLVIAVQSGAIAAEALNKLHRIGSMIEPLIIGDRGEAAVVSYDNEVLCLQPFTRDPDNISRGLGRLQSGGNGGRMIDAVAEAVRMLAAKMRISSSVSASSGPIGFASAIKCALTMRRSQRLVSLSSFNAMLILWMKSSRDSAAWASPTSGWTARTAAI